jgi:hypothetical protein
MNCVETDSLLSVAEALGDLPERKLAHIAQCAHCRSALNDLGILRAAIAPENLNQHQIERFALAIKPVARRRAADKKRLVLATVLYFLVVSSTLSAAVTLIRTGGQSYPGLLALSFETPLAFVGGLVAVGLARRQARQKRAA